MKKVLFIFSLLTFLCQTLLSQELSMEISEMTKKDVLNLTYDQLLELPFEDLLKLAEILGVSPDELYEIILNKDLVSASKKVESSFESPLSSSVISHDEIVESGARTIEEALRLIPGLLIREKTNGNFDVHIRGNDNLPPYQMLLYSENSITLVMIDSRPVYNYAHGGTFWETLPVDIDDIDRIEVVRGPSSALYGPNAVSGVVNIITRGQEDTKLSVHAGLQGGTQNTAITNLSIGKGINHKFSFRITGNFQLMNRNTDKVYVHKANGGTGGYLSLEELDTIHDPYYPSYYVFDPADDVYEMFPDPRKSRQRYGVNTYLMYNVNDDIAFDLKAGYQNSEVISSTMGDNPMSVVGRISNTTYIDLNGKVNGLHAQVNLLNGWQDIILGDTGFKVDIINLNSNLEYDIFLGNFNLRPGFSYQLASYDDLPYLRREGQGFLNGKRSFITTALSLRADYLAFEKLRFIGAIRGEKFSTHENIYISYQMVTSYTLNSRHNFRFVHSRANRGPFMVDTYADYYWFRDERPDPGYILFNGQKNLNFLSMCMMELGYRIKPIKKIQADVELFFSKTRDFGALYPDSVNLNGAQFGLDRPWVRMTYKNIDLESQQYGITGSVSFIIREDLVIKVHGTYQQTYLKNVIPYTQAQTIILMLEEAGSDTVTYSSTNFTEDREDIVNRATPSIFGSLSVQYKPTEKLSINVNGYFYSKQEFSSKYLQNINDPVIIEPKAIVNLKIGYSLFDFLDININTRNILGAKQEFGYMDDIGAIILIGMNFGF